MTPCQLLCVPPNQVADFWPHVEAMLRAGCERSLHDVAGMRRSLDGGDALLWLAWDGTAIRAAATTELHRINGRLHCFVAALGGTEHERWVHLLAGIESYARDEGCTSVIVMGRPAWRRLLAGYAQRGVILERMV